jgi:protein involved in polysaccharide export with SLBB domain
MNKKSVSYRLVTANGTRLLAGVVVVCSALAAVQMAAQTDRSRAIDQQYSRAEQEAEQLVSLSAEKIIPLLQAEPGLLLQVKKLLVRRAYEQGRLLDTQDLTDEALYRLIAHDDYIRALVTREIEERGYIRVKPTRRELERQRQSAMLQGAISDETQEESGDLTGKSQEDAYWSRRNQGSQSGAPSAPGVTPPSSPPQTPAPLSPSDRRRAIEQAQAQAQVGDYYTGLPLDVVGMQRVSPDQLSGLLTARLGERTSSKLAGGFNSNSSDMGMSGPMALGMGAGQASTPDIDSIQNDAKPPLAANLEARPRPPTQGVPKVHRDEHALKHRPNPYADVPSLYDLYSQYSQRPAIPERFGIDVFRNGTGNLDQLPMDVPAGPDYVVGPGDGLSIDLWGGISQRLRRVVDREGKLALPEIGGVQVAGRTLGDVQRLVQTALRSQFRDVQADVSLSRLRTVRVYVVGDVANPGAYNVSSLPSRLNALHEAGGPTTGGSLRSLKHYRGKQLVEDVDVYDLLLHGVRSGMQRLEAGDTILVPPLTTTVTIDGMVRRPAIYELKDEKSLAEVLELAGGVLPSGTLRHIDVERVQSHESRSMLALDIPETNNQESITQALEGFRIQDGDQVKISPIVAFADKTVFLDGHVYRPGKYAYRDGMKVADLIKTYKDLLPEPYKAHAEVIRLKAPDYTPEVLAFNLDDALAGKEQDLVLKPLDTIRVFGRFDFEDPPVITVTGEVRDPGDHVSNGATYLRDAIYLAGSTTPEAKLDEVQVFRSGDNGKLKVLSVNLSKALRGDESENILLQSKDRVFVHKNRAKTDPAAVTIEGEVGRPGKYPLGEGMSAVDLVRLAGGLKRSAYTEQADLTRYMVEHGEKMISDHTTIQMAKALAGEPDTDVRLHDGDVLTIRQLAGWNDIGSTISVTGEVVHPGTYGIQEGERLSALLARAGGLRTDAYPYGAVFQRAQVRDLEQKNHSQLVRQIQEQGAALKESAQVDPVTKESAFLQWKSTLEKLQNTPPSGRMVIHISSNIKKWADTAADVQVRAGDMIYIPKKPTFVMVDGSVYNPTAITYKPGKSAGWYLSQAGGPTAMANKKAIFVIRADGSVVGGNGGMFTGGALSVGLQPGDMVVVPDKAFGGGITWRNTLQVAQLVSAVGIAVQVARGF